jgi:hypothetical protein
MSAEEILDQFIESLDHEVARALAWPNQTGMRPATPPRLSRVSRGGLLDLRRIVNRAKDARAQLDDAGHDAATIKELRAPGLCHDVETVGESDTADTSPTGGHCMTCASHEESYHKLADVLRLVCYAVLGESTETERLHSYASRAASVAQFHRRELAQKTEECERLWARLADVALERIGKPDENESMPPKLDRTAIGCSTAHAGEDSQPVTFDEHWVGIIQQQAVSIRTLTERIDKLANEVWARIYPDGPHPAQPPDDQSGIDVIRCPRCGSMTCGGPCEA